ncbi:TonB-dependent hemoglobin/transferrin/lactoferrin family receptor [Gammaproteobacteria bacterium]|nr:TonB-dependent hemoglobin/transferrin/lactoferrin family receptor [Gammaproteobacteria bacterium]
MNTQKKLLASAITLALSSQVQAQSTAQELDLTTIESESIERDAVVEILTVEDINVRQIDNFEEMVRLVPGVSVSRGDDRWGSSGFNIRGLDEDRVAINVDGVPQGETLKYEGGQAYGYFKGSRNGVDIEALKIIEIVKGADAILSGSGSLAGAVNMSTKDPIDYLAPNGNDSGFGFKTEYSGVNDEAMASFVVANRTGRVESLLVYTRRDGSEYENYDTDGLDVTGSTREIPDPRETELNSVLLKLIYKATPNNEFGVVGSYYGLNGITDAQSFNGGWYSNRIGDDDNETTRIGLFHKYTADTALFDTIATALNRQEVLVEANTAQHVMFDFGPTFRSDEDRIDTRRFDQELTQFTVDLEKALEVGEISHKLVYGFELQNKDFKNAQTRVANSLLNNDGWVESNIGALIPRSEADIYTIYALDTFDLSNTTQIRIGGRYDDYTYDASADQNFSDATGTLREVSFSTANWTFGIEQALTDRLALEAGISTGFRAPTIEDMYSISGTVDDWGVVANPDLEAETSTNIDVALAGQFNSGYYRAGVFYSRYDNFIDYRLVNGINTNTGLADPNGFQVPFNFNEVDMRGVELVGYVDLNQAFGWAQGLTTEVQAAYTKGENANGDPVYSVQPFNLIWTLTYTNPNGLWGANLFTSHLAGKKNSDSYQTDAAGLRTYPLYLSNTATIVDLVAYYNLGDFRLTAGVYNLTDKEYYRWDNVRFVDQGDLRPGIGVTGNGVRRYTEPGRNFEVGVNYQF